MILWIQWQCVKHNNKEFEFQSALPYILILTQDTIIYIFLWAQILQSRISNWQHKNTISCFKVNLVTHWSKTKCSKWESLPFWQKETIDFLISKVWVMNRKWKSKAVVLPLCSSCYKKWIWQKPIKNYSQQFLIPYYHFILSS